jgi:hypothetical protein
MSIAKTEAALEETRKKIAEQEKLIIESHVTNNELRDLVQSIDPTLYEKERVLEQAVIDAHLDAPLVEDGAIDMPQVTLQDLLTEYKD